MRTATGLTVIAIGAILAFAVTTNTPVFNLNIAGWVLIVVGLIGIFLPRKSYGWLRRRLVLRSGARGPVISRIEETRHPRSVLEYPGAVDSDPLGRTWRPRSWLVTRTGPARRRVRAEATVREPMMPGDTETIEEFTEE